MTVAKLEDFSYGDFKSVAGGSGDFQTRYPTVWGWLLLLNLFASLQGDEGGHEHSPPEYHRVVEGLQALGLVPVPALNRLVTTSSKRAFKTSVPKFFEHLRETVSETQDLQMVQLVRALEAGIDQFRTDSRHVVFIDGLDAMITQRELQLQSIAALVAEAARLNNAFRRDSRPFKFVVLCRTDIFDRLPGANTNKIRQDASETLDWFDNPREPNRSKLVQLANLRAGVSLRSKVDVFADYLPPRLNRKDARKALLDHTRHTPRDLIQLLRKLQSVSNGASRLSPTQVKAGLRLYSRDYFVPEMRNELAGYLEDAQVDQSIVLLTSLPDQRLPYKRLEENAKELKLTNLDVSALARALFDCSCLGTIEERQGHRPMITFKYRNPNATLVPGATLFLHPATLKGLNIESPEATRRSAPRKSGRRRRTDRQ